MNRLIIVCILIFTLLFACMEPDIIVPASFGTILKTGDPFGDVFVFPSEPMDGIFFYYAYDWEDFGNYIYFYDFQTSRLRNIVYGGNDEGRGRLINRITGESLLGDTPESHSSGRIHDIFLHDDGSLVFQTEIGTKYRIGIQQNRDVHISETTATGHNAAFKLHLPYTLTDNITSVTDYATIVKTRTVQVQIENEQVSLFKKGRKYVITGIVPEGIHLSQDATQLAVFGKVAMMDVDFLNGTWRSERARQARMLRMEHEEKTHEEKKREEALLLSPILNAIVIYDMTRLSPEIFQRQQSPLSREPKPSSQRINVTGIWNGVLTNTQGEGQDAYMSFELIQDTSMVTGSGVLVGSSSGADEVVFNVEGKLEGTHLTLIFSFADRDVTIDFTGIVREDQLEGNWQVQDRAEGRFEATRQQSVEQQM